MPVRSNSALKSSKGIGGLRKEVLTMIHNDFVWCDKCGKPIKRIYLSAELDGFTHHYCRPCRERMPDPPKNIFQRLWSWLTR